MLGWLLQESSQRSPSSPVCTSCSPSSTPCCAPTRAGKLQRFCLDQEHRCSPEGRGAGERVKIPSPFPSPKGRGKARWCNRGGRFEPPPHFSDTLLAICMCR